MVVAADDVGDAHERVVDGDHVVVDRNAVPRLPLAERTQDRVADRFGGELDRAVDEVVEAQRMVFDFEADGEGLAGSEVLLDRRGVEMCGSGRSRPAGRWGAAASLRSASSSSGVQKQR